VRGGSGGEQARLDRPCVGALMPTRLSKTSAEPATPRRLGQIVGVVHHAEGSTELHAALFRQQAWWGAGSRRVCSTTAIRGSTGVTK